MPTLKLVYFELPGRAEVTRIMLNYAGIPFENSVLSHETWLSSVKATTPFGQVPILEVDGKVLAQSTAIERYVAKLAGLIPEDAWAAAKVDEAAALVNEMNDAMFGTFTIKDQEAKIKARQELLAGSIKNKLDAATRLIQASGGQFFGSDKLSYADIALYKTLSGWVGGILDGVPLDLLDSFPVLKEHHNRIASLPPIAKMYEGITEGMRLSYKPLP